MTLRDRWQRLVSRKSLYSSGSSANSSSSTSSTTDPTETPPTLASSGASTPLPVPISASTPHPLAPILNTNPATSSPTGESTAKLASSGLVSKSLTWRSSRGSGNNSTNNITSWSWGGGDSSKKESRKKKTGSGGKAPSAGQLPRRKVHPSERPLTEANLRQQEALSTFKWEFGRRVSLGGWSVESGISPCGSRRSSYDLRVHDMPLPPSELPAAASS